MKVDVLDAFLASLFLLSVGSTLLWFNETIIRLTADAVFERFQKQGAEDEEEEEEDLPAVCSECRDCKPPPVLVIDDVGKKCH